MQTFKARTVYGKDMAHTYTSRRLTGRKPAAPARRMGTWKLAYADFLTALCAFFLVMWIVHGVSAEDKAALAQQFGAETTATEMLIAERTDTNAHAALIAEQLGQTPSLQSFRSSVTITAQGDQVRIDLSDMAERPLFETGIGDLNATGRELVRLAGAAISYLDFPVLIEGHTDSNPSLTAGYSNWELSADRANSARRLMIDAGVAPGRIKAVSGLADTRPLFEGAPERPANRRISIVLVINGETA